MTVLVWSERNDPNSPGGAWRDCTYSSGLMGLVFAGKTSFPAGIYTVQEREALERSDAHPDETGAALTDLVTAIHNRYKLDVHVSAISYLADKHARHDLGFVIQGMNGNLPAGHTLRRWDPTFTGGHAVFINPVGDGTHVRWFDPEAPWKYAGDVTDWATVMKWIGTMPSFIMFRQNQFAPPAPAPAPTPTPPPVVPTPTPPPVPTPPPAIYTQAQYDAIAVQLHDALASGAAATTALKTASDALAAANAKITAAKAALG